MKITNTEQYSLLKMIADDIASSRACPKDLERYVKIVVQDNGQDKIVQKFSPDMTRAAILIEMVRAIEDGKSPMSVLDKKEKTKAKPQETMDEFTAAALALIPAGGPDSSTLNPPRDKMKKAIIAHIEKLASPPAITYNEGDEWTYKNGRRWKIVNGKKCQQKKIRA